MNEAAAGKAGFYPYPTTSANATPAAAGKEDHENASAELLGRFLIASSDHVA